MAVAYRRQQKREKKGREGRHIWKRK